MSSILKPQACAPLMDKKKCNFKNAEQNAINFNRDKTFPSHCKLSPFFQEFFFSLFVIFFLFKFFYLTSEGFRCLKLSQLHCLHCLMSRVKDAPLKFPIYRFDLVSLAARIVLHATGPWHDSSCIRSVSNQRSRDGWMPARRGSVVFTCSERHRNLRSLHDEMAFYRSSFVAGKLPWQPAAYHGSGHSRFPD